MATLSGTPWGAHTIIETMDQAIADGLIVTGSGENFFNGSCAALVNSVAAGVAFVWISGGTVMDSSIQTLMLNYNSNGGIGPGPYGPWPAGLQSVRVDANLISSGALPFVFEYCYAPSTFGEFIVSSLSGVDSFRFSRDATDATAIDEDTITGGTPTLVATGQSGALGGGDASPSLDADPSGACFVGGTPMQLVDGSTKAIEALVKGDVLWQGAALEGVAVDELKVEVVPRGALVTLPAGTVLGAGAALARDVTLTANHGVYDVDALGGVVRATLRPADKVEGADRLATAAAADEQTVYHVKLARAEGVLWTGGAAFESWRQPIRGV